MFIIKRSNFINTQSGMVMLCKRPSGAEVERKISFAVDLHTGRPLTERDHTRYCINTNLLLDDEHDVARNM
jgi:hypothetical protein